MYQNASLPTALPLIYHSITGRVGRPWIGGPIIGVGVSMIPGPGEGPDMIRENRAQLCASAASYRVRSREEHPRSSPLWLSNRHPRPRNRLSGVPKGSSMTSPVVRLSTC